LVEELLISWGNTGHNVIDTAEGDLKEEAKIVMGNRRD